MALSSDMYKKFAIINALSCIERPTLKSIYEKTNIPIPTIKRQIPVIRDSFDMEIMFVRNPGSQGNSGYYIISSWGVINKAEFLKSFIVKHGINF